MLPIDYERFFFIFSMALPRLFGCFLLLPILSKQMLGSALLRNGILFSLAIFIYPIMANQPLPSEINGLVIVVFLIKEIAIGILISFIITIPFWAIEAVGYFIDNQRGSTLGSSFNPALGDQSTPIGLLLTQTLVTLFFVSGGFLLLLGAIFESYHTWPVMLFFPSITDGLVSFFFGQFERMLVLCLVMSAPVIIAMFLAEFGLAIISLFAPQLNVFSLSMPVKSAVANAFLVIYVYMLMEYFSDSLLDILNFSTWLSPIIGTNP